MKIGRIYIKKKKQKVDDFLVKKKISYNSFIDLWKTYFPKLTEKLY